MRVSEAIKELQIILAQDGDLECFDAHSFELHFNVVEPDEEEYPKDWNMPSTFVSFGEVP